MLGSIVNAGARLVLPTLADKVGRIVCIKGVLIVAVIAMGVLAVSRSLAVTVAVVLMYGCYGGIMGSFPSLTSSIFGMKHTGENYGFVMFGIVFATFGAPAISGLVSSNGYELNAQVGIPAKLSDTGVTDEYFAQMTEDAMKSGNIAVNPQKTVQEDILALYREAL